MRPYIKLIFATLFAISLLIACQGEDVEVFNGIRGSVTDTIGNPIPSATVLLTRDADSSSVSRQSESTALTDKNGRFSFRLVGSGVYNITVTTNDGQGSFKTNISFTGTGALTIDLVVTPVGAITGKAVLEDRPDDSEGIDVYVPGTSFIAKTTSNGEFVISGVPAGEYGLTAQYAGYLKSTVTKIVVTSGQTTNVSGIITLQSEASTEPELGRVSGTVVVSSAGAGSGRALGGVARAGGGSGVSDAAARAAGSDVSAVAFDESNLDFVAGEIVVRFVGGGLAASAVPVLEAAGESLSFERALAAEGMRLYRSLGLGKAETLAVVRDLNARADVLYAFPNYIYRAAKAPDDSFYDRQWHYDAINMEAAWDVTTGSGEVVVAVIDSGIISDHPDFAGRLLSGYDFITDAASANDGDGRDADPYDDVDTGAGYHGTHVAGTIGAATDNGLGVAGVDWAAKILPLRVLGDGGTFVDVTDAMLWAVGASVPGVPFTNPDPADVINLSLGGQQECVQGWQDVIDIVSQFAVVVAAAGNDTISANGFAPANCSDVIAVGATDFNGERSWYSNFGSAVDVMAPGGDLAAMNFAAPRPDGVLSTGYNGSPEYVYMQGTSMAAPHITGLVALMKALDLSVDTNFALAALKASATPLTDAECDGPSNASRELFSADCGAGLVDAALALQYISDGVVPPPNDGVLSFSPATLELGSSSEEASYTIRNVSDGPISWLLDTYLYAPDTPGASIPEDAVLTSIGSGSLGVNETQELTLYVNRDALTEGGYYRFWLQFEVAGEPDQLYQVSFQHSILVIPTLSGPMIITAYQDDQFGDLVVTGSQESSGVLSTFDFEVESGSTLLGAWSDENDDRLVNSGDYVGFSDSYYTVAPGQLVSGLNLTLQQVFGSPSGLTPEYLRQLEELRHVH